MTKDEFAAFVAQVAAQYGAKAEVRKWDGERQIGAVVTFPNGDWITMRRNGPIAVEPW